MITEDEIRNQKIWDEVIKNRTFRTDILPHERTKTQLMKEYHIGRSQIDALLKEMLENGEVTSRPAIDGGKSCIAYSFILKE